MQITDFYKEYFYRLKFIHYKVCGEHLLDLGGEYYTRSIGSWLLVRVTDCEKTRMILSNLIYYRKDEVDKVHVNTEDQYVRNKLSDIHLKETDLDL